MHRTTCRLIAGIPCSIFIEPIGSGLLASAGTVSYHNKSSSSINRVINIIDSHLPTQGLPSKSAAISNSGYPRLPIGKSNFNLLEIPLLVLSYTSLCGLPLEAFICMNYLSRLLYFLQYKLSSSSVLTRSAKMFASSIFLSAFIIASYCYRSTMATACQCFALSFNDSITPILHNSSQCVCALVARQSCPYFPSVHSSGCSWCCPQSCR